MKARLLEPQTILHSEMNEGSPPVETLTTGAEFDINKVVAKGGRKWVEVKIPSGATAYMKGDVRVFMIKKASLLDKEAEVREQPSAESPVTLRLTKGQTFEMEDVVEGDGQKWVRIHESGGNVGFIRGNVRIRDITAPVAAVADPGKDMLYGALWCIGGIVVTAATYSAAENGGSYVIAWGAILFGGIQFLKGLFRAISN